MGLEQPTRLIGREHEVGRCTSAVDALPDGRGRLLHLVGEVGVGKSALAAHVGEAAADRDIPVAWGRPLAGRRSDTPYGTWGRALQRLSRGATSPLTGLLGEDTGLDEARQAVLEAVRGPTVLVLDDLHRADDHSRWLVEHLLDDLHRLPLLLVAATRPSEDPGVTDDVARWGSHAATVRLLLDRLGEDDTAALLSARMGEEIPRTHPLVAFAEGSPAEAGELAERWRSEVGRRRLLARIARHVDEHNDHDVLSTLAALEQPCTQEFHCNAKTTTISNLIGQPAERTLVLLHRAQRAGLVGRSRGGEWWTITHPLVVDAALDEPVRTAMIHRRLAEALLVIEAEEDSGVLSAECAGQFVLAGQPRPDVSWRAARWYLDTGRPRLARDLVIATVTTSLAEEDQIALNRLAGVAHAALGDVEQADDYLNGMINRARVRGLVLQFADAVADLLVWLPAIPDRSRVELIDEALGLLDQLDRRTRVRLLGAAAHALTHLDHDRATQLWRQADEEDWQTMDRRAATDVLALPAVHGCQADQPRITDAVHVLDGLDQRYGHGRALAAVGRLSLALMRGTHDQIARALDHLDVALDEWPSPELASYGAAARLALARFDADPTRVAALTADASWLQTPPQSPAAVLLAVGHLVWQQTLGGLQPLSEAASRACRVDAPDTRRSMDLAAVGISAMGNPDLSGELRERLDALGVEPEDVPRDHRWAGQLVGLAVFAGVAGDIDRATRAADLLEPHREEMAVLLPTGVAGPIGLHIAHARLAAADVIAADDAIDAALRCCDRVTARSWGAMTRLLQARVALLDQRLDDARTSLAAARRLAQRERMPVVCEELQRLDEQVAALEHEGVGGRLSGRELEVLHLVAGGATNRQVARTLSISPKTVEYHLAGTFRSLGAANRTEAVELARRARLLGPSIRTSGDDA